MNRIMITVVSFLLLSVVNMNEAQNSVSRLTADLSTNILKSLASDGGNSVFSPLSVAVGMGMLHQGAGGATRRDVADAMGLPNDDNQLRKDFKAAIPPNSNSTSLNSLIAVAKDAEIYTSYAEVVRGTFGGNPFQHTFDTKPGFASFSINQWVQKRSGGKIKQLLPRGSISKSTKMVLVNVLSFRANWLNPFEVLSEPLPFTTSDGSDVTAKMMFSETQMGFKEVSGQKVIAVPLEDEDTDLVIVYPGKGKGVSESLMALAREPALVGAVLDPEALPRVQVALTMPKFKVVKRLKLKQTMANLYPGVSSIFEPNADFSRMAKDPEGIVVDEIHHMALMDVNEKGIEAVGATGVAITLYSNFPAEATIDLESPFLAFLVNKKTKTILFAAAVEDPTK